MFRSSLDTSIKPILCPRKSGPTHDELHGNPQAALCFYWRSIGRQVRVEGAVVAVTDTAADA